MPLFRKHQLIIVAIITLLVNKSATAQINIALNDIEKIDLITAGAGLAARDTGEFEIISQNDIWKCYLIRLHYAGAYYRLLKDSAVFSKLNSQKRTFIRIIPADDIEDMLSSLRKPIPIFRPEKLPVTVPEITAWIDSGKLKGLSNKRKREFLRLINTRKKLYRTLDSLQKDWWTDDNPHCRIRMILKSGDTIQLDSWSQRDFMLPWMINNKPDFDPSISQFFASCIGNYPYMQQTRLSGKYIAEQICDYLDFAYAQDMFAREDWQRLLPKNYASLTRHFRILKLGNDFRFKLQPKKLPHYVQIFGFVNIKSKTAVDSLISYAEDSVKRYISRNFVATACKEKKINISFSFDHNQYANRYILNLLCRKYNALNNYAFNQIVAFQTGNDNWPDAWLLLPDGKIVLISYFRHAAPGVSSDVLLQTHNRGVGEVYIEFSKNGKVLLNDSR